MPAAPRSVSLKAWLRTAFIGSGGILVAAHRSVCQADSAVAILLPDDVRAVRVFVAALLEG